MADIAAERAWMRKRAADARAEDEAASQRRAALHVAEVAATCAYCFHATHASDLVSASWSGRTGDPWVTEIIGPPAVLWCANPLCLCGVPPCPGCGERDRPTLSETLTLTCPWCRLVTYPGATA